MYSFLVTAANIDISYKLLKKLEFLTTFLSHTVWSIFNHCDVTGSKDAEFGSIRKMTAITEFKVIQGHRFWYQSKAHMRLPISH